MALGAGMVAESRNTPVGSGRGRPLGIPVIPEAPWGAHFCHFYQNKQDLLDVLVPYFRQGIENNEFCVWVTSTPLQTTAAIEAMHASVPSFDGALRSGQIEIRSYRDVYFHKGRIDPDRIVSAWLDKLHDVRAGGFDGMRGTGNTPWFDEPEWHDFTGYETLLNESIREYPIIAICTYSFADARAGDVIDVLRNHELALVRRDGTWSVIEPSERGTLQQARAELRAAQDQLAEQARRQDRLARELNDTIVEGLVAAELSYDLGEAAQARQLLRTTSRQARDWVGRLLSGQVPPGAA